MNAMRKLFVVMGSPVYWHNICASVRTLMERFYGYVPENTFKGKRLFFLYQGAAPTQMMIDDGEYTMSRFAGMYGFDRHVPYGLRGIPMGNERRNACGFHPKPV